MTNLSSEEQIYGSEITVAAPTNINPTNLIATLTHSAKATDNLEQVTSAVWKFYKAGEWVQNYAPFPASAVRPSRRQTINNAGKVVLAWSGSDVDFDIDGYEVFFGTDK